MQTCAPQVDRRQRILILIILNLALQIIIIHNNQTNQAALVLATFTMSKIQSFKIISQFLLSQFMFAQGQWIWRKQRCVWRFERSSPFVDKILLRAHSEYELRRRVRVSQPTFYYLCSLLAPALQKSKKGGGISLETRVALSLNRLGIGNYLLARADVFGMSEGLASIVVREFCEAVVKIIRPLVVKRWTPSTLKTLASEFEAKHGIPYIMGAIDGSHIPIIAPPAPWDPAPYYNRKGFYSVLLQGIVDVNKPFLDWDFRWAGSLHDYTMFIHSDFGRAIMTGSFAPYKIIGDAAYPFRQWNWVPFTGSTKKLEPHKAHWNFIQSSTRMCVERAFGVLKGRWRILLRRIEMRIENVSVIVSACICLHNLCVAHKDFIDEQMVEEAKKWLQVQQIRTFGNLQQVGTLKIMDYGRSEVNRAHIEIEELIKQASAPDPYFVNDLQSSNSSDVGALERGINMHRQMAEVLFNRHLKEQVDLPTTFFEEVNSAAEEDGTEENR